MVRWFGGTKLGKGGLVRAYGGVAREAIAAVGSRRRLQRTRLALDVPYAQVGALQRLLRPPEVELLEESYGEVVRMVLAVSEDRLAAVRDVLAALGLEAREGP